METPEDSKNQKIHIRLGGAIRTLMFKPVQAYVHTDFLGKRQIASGKVESWCRADCEEKRLRKTYPELEDCFRENFSLDGENMHVIDTVNEKGQHVNIVELKSSEAIVIDFYPLRQKLCKALSEMNQTKVEVATLRQILNISKTNADLFQKLKEFKFTELGHIAKSYGLVERLMHPAASPHPLLDAHRINSLQQFKEDVSYALDGIQRLMETPPPQRQR